MPDLNSVPASPHSLATPRQRSSHQIPHSPSANDSTALNILPSNQSAVNPGPSSSHHPPQATAAASQPATASAVASELGVGSGPGPLRHPRPLTATELHALLEKEQEAVVNRLTRELSFLRAAQNASVVSNASSASAGASGHEPATDNSLLTGSGFSIPTSRRHHRTSSATSQNAPAHLHGASQDHRGHLPRPAQPIPLSRQDSAASRQSQTHSPSSHFLDRTSYFQHQRVPPTTSIPSSSVNATPGSGSLPEHMSPGLVPATSRFEETAFHKSELEVAQRENDALKKRIRELEKLVREGRNCDEARRRRESVSTTASVSLTAAGGSTIAPPRDSAGARQERERGMTTQSTSSLPGSVAVGVPEDEVLVGESAASRLEPER